MAQSCKIHFADGQFIGLMKSDMSEGHEAMISNCNKTVPEKKNLKIFPFSLAIAGKYDIHFNNQKSVNSLL